MIGMAPKPEKLLERLRRIAESLPEVTFEPRLQHATFFVAGKKKFAYFLNDHHGDGIVAVSTRAGPGENTELVASDPDRFYLPAYLGPRGWIALRLDHGRVDWTEVSELVTDGYLLAAPKRLARLVEVPPRT
jgi:hypothetical protein